MLRNVVDPNAVCAALHERASGIELDFIAKLLGLYRRRRRWWFDESDDALRRRCAIVFVEKYDVVKLEVTP